MLAWMIDRRPMWAVLGHKSFYSGGYMATRTLIYKPAMTHNSFSQTLFMICTAAIKRLTPRPHMISSTGLLLVGLGIPLLMLLELIPATIFLGFIALALIAAGSLLIVYYI